MLNGFPTSTRLYEQRGTIVPGPAATKEAIPFVLPRLSPREKECIERAKKYAMEQSIKSVLLKQSQQFQQQQMNSVKRAQALVLLSRLYVGSVSYQVTEEHIRNAFLPFGPIKEVSMSWDPLSNRHKGFAFVEFEYPEAAQIALEQMNGVLMSGRNLKVGRPSNVPQAQPIIDELISEAKLYNRIYIASVHSELSEGDLKSVFEAFGKVTFCQLMKEPNNSKHRGFGFIEYESAQSAADAVSSMNLFDLGGQLLRVGKALTPPNAVEAANAPPQTAMPAAAAVAAASVTAQVLSMEAEQVSICTPPNGSQLSPGHGTRLATAVHVPAPPSVPSNASPVGGAGGLGSGGKFGGYADAASVIAVQAQALPQPPSHIPPPAVVIPQLGAAVPPVAMPVTASHDIPSLMATQGHMMSSQPQDNLGFPMANPNNSLPIPMETGQEVTSIAAQENLNIKGRDARHMIMQKLMRKNETRVVVLRNMVGPEGVDSELESEVTDECGLFGNVERVIIYQEAQSEAQDAEVQVKIFVEFSDPTSVGKCIEALNGRYFDGRVVRAEGYDQNLYDAQDLSG